MPAPNVTLTGSLADRDSWQADDNCPIRAAIEVIGTRSSCLILREAFYGATRFDQFVSRGQISEPVAAAKLKELTELGLLRKEPYREEGQRTRYEYRLTQKGAELLPAIVALFAWGDRWQLDTPVHVELTHAGCGVPVEAVLQCAHGHAVEPDELELRARRRAARA